MSQAKPRYQDLNTYYGVLSEVDVLQDEAAIVNSILNVTMIPKRSRKWRSSFGSSTYAFLGRGVSPLVASELEAALLMDYQKWVLTAIIKASDISVVPMSNNAGYNLYVSYQSRLTGVQGKVAFALAALTNN